MQRRAFTTTLIAGTALGSLASVGAQTAGPVDGVHYKTLKVRAPVSAPTGQIEVVEFFWYGCPHCNALEPALETWVGTLAKDVAFRRVPVAFSATHESHQKLFYTLEAMGVLETMHRKIFAAIHVERQRLDRDADQVAFVAANGVDGAKFASTAKSFSVQTRMRQAKQLTNAYDIDGVPSVGVHGRYLTSGSLAGDNVRSLSVADFLVDKIRRGA
jgi:thiol:disulfide interchange protein DsbA